MSDTSFAVASGSSLAVSGDISGNGSLTESGGGVLTLSGAIPMPAARRSCPESLSSCTPIRWPTAAA